MKLEDFIIVLGGIDGLMTMILKFVGICACIKYLLG